MRILHTADWHLGDRLGRIDRTADLRRAVERIAGYCEQEHADVLLVAGDLFSELSRPDGLRDSLSHLQQVFLPFLRRGGSIVVLTGNHDNENFCQTMLSAMALAAPVPEAGCQPGGRLYLAPNAGRICLADRAGLEVEFLLLPYPTPARYLDEPAQRFNGLEEKHRALQKAFMRKLRSLLRDAPRPGIPTVLAAHVHVQSAVLPGLFRLSKRESLLLADQDVPTEPAYVALGHIHQPQSLLGHAHIRYSGSIDRLDLGERHDQKSVILFEVGPDGLQGEPTVLPLDATPIYEVHIDRPREQLPRLREQYPDADRALVRYEVTFQPGTDNLHEILGDLEKIFPRWYDREWREASALTKEGMGMRPEGPGEDFAGTVLSYLRRELAGNREETAVLELAETLLAEGES